MSFFVLAVLRLVYLVDSLSGLLVVLPVLPGLLERIHVVVAIDKFLEALLLSSEH